MFLPELVQHCYKDIRMRYLKFNSIHKEIKSSQQVVIKLAAYGTLIPELKFRYLRDIRMISFLVLSIMKAIL